MLFVSPPPIDLLADEFLRDYHRYADCLYRVFLDARPHCPLTSANFHFELYASGEYSRLLESEWGQG